MVTSPYAPFPLLKEGDRIRHKKYPELTGYIKHYEYNKPGVLSPIPYCVGWDDSADAAKKLGWFFVYVDDSSIEAENAS